MRKLLLYFFLSLWMISCSKSNYEDPNILVVAIDSAPRTLDPRYATDANGQRIIGLLFQALVRISKDLNIEGEAAVSWQYKNLKYTFQLQPELRFSNGDKVSANDVLFTFEEYRKPDSPFKSSLNVIRSIRAKEENGFATSVEIELNSYSATFLTDLVSIKLLPKQRVELYKKDFSRNLVGSGYYYLQEEDINLYKLKKNSFYPHNPAQSESIYFKVIQDDSTRYLKLRKGELDIVQNAISPLRVKDFLNKQDFVVTTYPGLSMSYILINLKDPILKNKNVRLALAKSINSNDIIKYKMEDLAIPATSILSPNNPFYNQKILPISFDVNEAKNLLRNLGPIQLQLKTSNSLDIIEHAKILTNQISQTGIQMSLQSYEWGTFYNDIKTGNFQLAMMRWVGATDPDIYRIALHTKELPPGRNRGAYSNKELDQLLDKGLITENIKQRKEIYDQVQEIIREDMPYVPLWYNQQVAIAHKRVKDYVPRTNGDFLGFIYAHK